MRIIRLSFGLDCLTEKARPRTLRLLAISLLEGLGRVQQTVLACRGGDTVLWKRLLAS